MNAENDDVVCFQCYCVFTVLWHANKKLRGQKVLKEMSESFQKGGWKLVWERSISEGGKTEHAC